ncbi:hypothetical protein [Kutzneria kofuensis]|uniref:hypothetical protein n=1 Tax=Kutzneria kofuensis TaxID=103725 RepID=UPI0031E6B74D
MRPQRQVPHGGEEQVGGRPEVDVGHLQHPNHPRGDVDELLAAASGTTSSQLMSSKANIRKHQSTAICSRSVTAFGMIRP